MNLVGIDYVNEKDKELTKLFIESKNIKKYILGINKLGKSVLKYLEVDGIIISRNTASLVKPKHINLKKPNFVYKVDGTNGLFKVKISSDVNALWVFIDIGTVGHRCSDNFFDMRQGAEYEIEVFTESDILKEELVKMIKVKSILDLV